MSKQEKELKPRPNKYDAKLAINATFSEAMKVLADHANKVVEDAQNEHKKLAQHL